jgi:hypothetical protein
VKKRKLHQMSNKVCADCVSGAIDEGTPEGEVRNAKAAHGAMATRLAVLLTVPHTSCIASCMFLQARCQYVNMILVPLTGTTAGDHRGGLEHLCRETEARRQYI